METVTGYAILFTSYIIFMLIIVVKDLLRKVKEKEEIIERQERFIKILQDDRKP